MAHLTGPAGSSLGTLIDRSSALYGGEKHGAGNDRACGDAHSPCAQSAGDCLAGSYCAGPLPVSIVSGATDQNTEC